MGEEDVACNLVEDVEIDFVLVLKHLRGVGELEDEPVGNDLEAYVWHFGKLRDGGYTFFVGLVARDGITRALLVALDTDGKISLERHGLGGNPRLSGHCRAWPRQDGTQPAVGFVRRAVRGNRQMIVGGMVLHFDFCDKANRQNVVENL